MKQYKVIALSVGGRANKIFSAGDTVNEEHFIPGRADELETQGFLKLIGDDGKPRSREVQEDISVEVAESREDSLDDSKESPAILVGLKNSLGGNNDAGIDSISKKEIVKVLTDLGVPFEPGASKKELYELYQSRENY
jgi:hypothetical protein